MLVAGNLFFSVANPPEEAVGDDGHAGSKSGEVEAKQRLLLEGEVEA